MIGQFRFDLYHGHRHPTRSGDDAAIDFSAAGMDGWRMMMLLGN
jgi:hypothetical protein